MRTNKVTITMDDGEKIDLLRLASAERLPIAAIVRRLIWQELQRHGVADPAFSETKK